MTLQVAHYVFAAQMNSQRSLDTLALASAVIV